MKKNERKRKREREKDHEREREGKKSEMVTERTTVMKKRIAKYLEIPLFEKYSPQKSSSPF